MLYLLSLSEFPLRNHPVVVIFLLQARTDRLLNVVVIFRIGAIVTKQNVQQNNKTPNGYI